MYIKKQEFQTIQKLLSDLVDKRNEQHILLQDANSKIKELIDSKSSASMDYIHTQWIEPSLQLTKELESLQHQLDKYLRELHINSLK